jgi:hypothetical protein
MPINRLDDLDALDADDDPGAIGDIDADAFGALVDDKIIEAARVLKEHLGGRQSNLEAATFRADSRLDELERRLADDLAEFERRADDRLAEVEHRLAAALAAQKAEFEAALADGFARFEAAAAEDRARFEAAAEALRAQILALAGREVEPPVVNVYPEVKGPDVTVNVPKAERTGRRKIISYLPDGRPGVIDEIPVSLESLLSPGAEGGEQ